MNLELKEFKKERVVYLSEEINATTVTQLKKDINAIIEYDADVFNHNYNELKKIGDDYADMYYDNHDFPEIILELSSPGGYVYYGLGLYDYIKKINNEGLWKIVCNANGMNASMSTIVMLACQERIGTNFSSYMVHSLSDLEYGKLQDIRDGVEEAERLNNIMYKIYLENTKFTKEELDEIVKMKKDFWMDSEKALNYGLITDIK